jgi:glucans biosynthesis protein C
MNTKPAVRNNYLDWLRMLAILFVLVYHSTRFFNLEDWEVKNPVRYQWVELWNLFSWNWMMPLIFVISGRQPVLRGWKVQRWQICQR